MVKFQIMLDQTDIDAIDDYRFKLRFTSRAEAMRVLIRMGLFAQGYRRPEADGPFVEASPSP